MSLVSKCTSATSLAFASCSSTFLLNDDAGRINGQVLSVDGGTTMRSATGAM
jgi:hypothetical protein